MFIYGSAVFSADSILILSGKHPYKGEYFILTNSLLLSANISFLVGSVLFLMGHDTNSSSDILNRIRSSSTDSDITV